MYRLVFLTGKMKGRRLAVQQGSLLIGRDPECQLDLLDDDEVSRHHAIIEQRADGLYIKDIGAKNPIEINGRAVKEWNLKHNDKIEIGRTVMQFQLVEASAAGMRRRSSPMQLVAFALMGLLLAAQVAYLLIFPLWQQRTAPTAFKTSAPKASKTVAPEPAPPTATEGIEAELQQAMAQAEKENASATASAASVPSTNAPQHALNEVAEIRENLAELRKQVEGMAAEPAATAAVSTVAAALPVESGKVAATETRVPMPEPQPAPALPVPPPPEPPKQDVLLEKARELLTEALVEEQKHNLVQADNLMERVQVLAPNFVPAYVERARLYESRGMLKKAGEQWYQVMNRTMGSPLYEQAAAERQRLARAEIIMTMTKEAPATDTTPGSRLPRRIRIMSVERERFDASKDYDEMRIVRVTLKSRLSEGDIDTGDFSAVFTFYDRGVKTNKVLPSQAVVPKKPVTVEGLWRAGEQKTLTAAYIVSKGFRVDEEEETHERHAFEGVRIQIYYKDVLQDEEAVPKSLLALDAPPPPYADKANAPVGR